MLFKNETSRCCCSSDRSLWRKMGRQSLVAALVLGFLLTNPGGQPATAAEDVVLGAILPMTGGSAPSGLQMKGGYEIAVEEVNAQGGIKSLGGAKLKLVIRDHEGKPDVGARLAEMVISSEKAAIVLGTYMSGVAAPVSNVIERMKTPFLITDAQADEITERGFKFVFRIDIKSELNARAMLLGVKWWGEKLGTPITKIALLNEESAFGQAVKIGMEKHAKALNLNIVENLQFKSGSPDLSAQAARIKASSGEWVLGSWYINDFLSMIKTFPSMGINITRTTSIGGGVQSPSTLAVGEQANGITGFTQWNPDLKRPGVKELADKFKKRYQVDMNQNGAKAYAGVWVIKDVLERAGTLDKDKVREAFTKTNLNSGPAMVLPNKITFDATGQCPGTVIGIQVQKGKFVTVWPEDVAAGTPDLTRVKLPLVQ